MVYNIWKITAEIINQIKNYIENVGSVLFVYMFVCWCCELIYNLLFSFVVFVLFSILEYKIKIKMKIFLFYFSPNNILFEEYWHLIGLSLEDIYNNNTTTTIKSKFLFSLILIT